MQTGLNKWLPVRKYLALERTYVMLRSSRNEWTRPQGNHRIDAVEYRKSGTSLDAAIREG